MKDKKGTQFMMLIVACSLVFGAHALVKAACKKTVDITQVTYSPSGSNCTVGKTKTVCEGKNCKDAGTGEEGMCTCTPSQKSVSCNKYVGETCWIFFCCFEDAGTVTDDVDWAALSGSSCQG